MRIAVINGSPKGKNSITLQTSIYLSKKFTEHEFRILNAAQLIKLLEKDFSRAEEILEWAEIVVFSYPVYTFLAPYGMHKFIELLKASGIDLSGKWATQISTSKHFYDITAAAYIEDNIADLGMRYVNGLLADMDDLLTERGREEAVGFFKYLVSMVESGVEDRIVRHRSGGTHTPKLATIPTEAKPGCEKDIVIITDGDQTDTSLGRMIARFQANIGYKTRIVDISKLGLLGGCIGCFACAVSSKCVYPDGFDSYLRESIQTADAIVYAFSIKDHSMGPLFKMYDDRNFCNGHRTVTVGMPIGYLISGDYSEEDNLRTVVEARASVGHNFLAGVATDEDDPDGTVDALCARISYAFSEGYVPPQSFYGVGGLKIFRDLIYEMRGMMRADHKFYKKNGFYDFPQKKWARSYMMYLVGFLLGNEKLRRKIKGKMNEGMLMPYVKLFRREFGEDKKQK
ncbi:MAG: NAD(P)H-dependent oxidoreductase [Clostridia bacterium]|nr:NAD(P)H-dependent oxidoreductase [Clostridia bacterium]